MAYTPGESATQGYLGLINGCTGVAYSSPTTLVTNNAAQTKTLTSITIFNFHSAAVVCNIYYLPNNATAVRTPASEDDYKFFQISVAADDTEVVDIPWQLNATNDTVRVYSSVTAVTNYLAMGYEE